MLPAGADWVVDPSGFRGQNGSRHTFLCPADGRSDRIWGTDVYTDDSSVCTAGVHAGVIDAANGGTVTVEIRPGEASYSPSTRNGVTSLTWASWSGSFVVVAGTRGGGAAGVKMGEVGWSANARPHRGKNGSRYRYLCPPAGAFGSVWGTNVYTDDSSVCTAAVQVGVITRAAGGNVTIEVRAGERSYAGFVHNGVTSRDWPAYDGSFAFAGAPPIPGSPGSGGGAGGGGGGGGTTTTPSAPGAPPTATTTGTVLVNGQPFTTGTIPYGATVDVTNGAVTLRADVGTLKVNGAGGLPAAFRLVRARDRNRPIVELRLAKGSFAACPKRRTSSASQTAPTTVVRQLWGDGKGKFRTRGRYASATVRGTAWLTADRCDGTFVRIRRGRIQVDDLPNRRQVTLGPGRTYLARP